MVSNAVIAAVASIVVISLIGVIIGVIYFVRHFKEKGILRSFFGGLVSFFIVEYLIRMPFLRAFSTVPGFQELQSDYYGVYLLLNSLITSAFSLLASWFTLKIILKGKLSYGKSFMAGFGQGGIAFLTVIEYTMISNFYSLTMINKGIFNKVMIESNISQKKIDEVMDVLTKSSEIDYMLQFVQQVLIMSVQIGLVILLSYFMIKGKQILGVTLYIILHTIIHFGSGMLLTLSNQTLGESMSILLTGLIFLVLTHFIRQWKQAMIVKPAKCVFPKLK